MFVLRATSLFGVVFLFATTLLFGSVVQAQPTARSGYQTAWYDEFNSGSVDTSIWTIGNTNSPTNFSLQDYLPSQVTSNGGDLVITSENISSRGLPYRSGLIESKTFQKYGRWDIRAKLPTSKGMWPAIWLLADAPWPSEGEIDIMENRGTQPNLTSSAFHYGTNTPFVHNFVFAEQGAVHDSAIQNYHDSYHLYSVEWDPTQIRFFVDNVHYWTVRDDSVGGFLSNNVGEMRLIINTAIGGTFLDDPDNTTVWPQEFRIDYVHAFDRIGEPTLTFENGGFEDGGGSLAEWSIFGNQIFNVSSGNEEVESGAEALKLYGQFNGTENFSGVAQGISVTPGDELFLSADAFINAQDSIAGTANEVFLKIDYFNTQWGLFGTSEYISSDSVVLANGSSANNVWNNEQFLSIVPNGAVEARVAIVFAQRNNSGGAVFVDNVEFNKTSTILERGVTYGGSSFTETVFAPDKFPLLPGQTATFANYTSYTKGLNRVAFDIEGVGSTLSPSDFEFRVGNNDDPSTWTVLNGSSAIPLPSITVGTPVVGVSQVLLSWPDNAIENAWLQVVVLDTPNTRLTSSQTFYFGNAIAETGNAAGDTRVNLIDVGLTRANQTGFSSAPIDNHFDFDRDGRVNLVDVGLCRSNQSGFTSLQLISPPANRSRSGDSADDPVKPASDQRTKKAVSKRSSKTKR